MDSFGLFELLPNKWIFQTKIWDIVSLQSCQIVQENFFFNFFCFYLLKYALGWNSNQIWIKSGLFWPGKYIFCKWHLNKKKLIFWTKNWPLIPGFLKIDKENLTENFLKFFFYSTYIIFCILKQKKCGSSDIYIFEIIPLLWHSACAEKACNSTKRRGRLLRTEWGIEACPVPVV